MTMTGIFTFLDSIGFLVIKMLTSIIWQSSILFAVLALIVFILKRNSAAIRHRFWVLFILLMPVFPLAAWFMSATGAAHTEINVFPSYSLPAITVVENPAAVNGGEESVAPMLSGNTAENPIAQGIYPWAIAFLGYMMFAVFFLGMVAVGKLRIRKWVYRGTVIADKKLIALLENVRHSLGISRGFVVIKHKDVPAPLTVGVFHPVLLVPENYISQLSDFELRALAYHEYAHIKRKDTLILSIVSVIRSVFFFHPLVWIAAHNIATLAEDSCDDIVINRIEDPIEYAEMLTKLAVKVKERYFSNVLAAGFIFSRHIFLRRIEKILSDRKDQLLTISKPVLSGMFTVIGLTLMFVFLVPLGEVISQTSDGLVTFRAKVIDSQTGKPVANVRFSSYKHKEIEGVSNQDGMVEIPGMMPGSFSFVIKSENYTRCLSKKARNDIGKKEIYTSRGWRFYTNELKFKLKQGMKPVEIVIEKGVRITGHVFDPDGNPVAGATIDPALTGTGNSLTGDNRFSFVTAEDGSYEMILPASGSSEYNLIAHDGEYILQDGKFELRNWANGFSEPFKTEIGQEINDFDIYLTRPTTVKGRVVDENGNPRPKYCIQSIPADQRGIHYYGPQTKTDEKGNFTLEFIPPGKNYILSSPIRNLSKLDKEYRGRIITLKAGEILEGITLVGEDRLLMRNE